MYLHALWILPLALLIAFLSSPRARGDIAETRVRRLLESGLEKARYTVINDLDIPSGAGSVRVDHLVVSKFGVFVIESVYARGWISGAEFQERWTRQHLGRSDRLENPLHRNALQAEAVARLTGLPDSRLHPLVVMVGAQGFGTAMPDRVLVPEKLLRFIRSKGQMLLDDDQAAKVLAKIRETGSTGGGAAGQAGRRRLLLGVAWAVLLIGSTLAFREPVANWWQDYGAALTSDQETAAGPDDETTSARERREEALICAYSSDTGRCSCYEPEGAGADIPTERCRELAEQDSILRR